MLGRIIMVGDDKQAIYGFRGADSNSLDRMKERLAAREYGLPMTYRCGKAIVAEVSELVPDYLAFEENHEGEVVQSKAYKDIFSELGPGMAVISRKNAPLVPGCLRCMRLGIKARIEGKDIGRGLISLVEQLAGKRSRDIVDFFEKLANWERKQIEIIAAANGRSQERRTEEVQDKAETIRSLAEGMFTVDELVERIKFLFTDSADEGTNDLVIFSTVHKAKGLEWDTVYGLMDTLYPGGRVDSSEEKNIHYVMVTRAKHKFVKVYGYKDEE